MHRKFADGGYLCDLSPSKHGHVEKRTAPLQQVARESRENLIRLYSVSQRLLKVQDEERRKLSRDLHDSTGQTLAALKMAVACLQEDCKQYPSAMLLASEVAGMADVAIEEIRTMSYLLHPPLLDEVGFACAAEWYVEGFAKRTGIKVKLDLATSAERLPGGIEVALFRVLQEGLATHDRSLSRSLADPYLVRDLRPRASL